MQTAITVGDWVVKTRGNYHPGFEGLVTDVVREYTSPRYGPLVEVRIENDKGHTLVTTTDLLDKTD